MYNTYIINYFFKWNEHKLRHAYLKIDDPNAVLNVEEAEFEDQADADLASQVIALSEEKSEIDYIRSHLGMFYAKIDFSFCTKIVKTMIANHAFELLSIFDAKHPAMKDFQAKIKAKNDSDWNISDLCKCKS